MRRTSRSSDVTLIGSGFDGDPDLGAPHSRVVPSLVGPGSVTSLGDVLVVRSVPSFA